MRRLAIIVLAGVSCIFTGCDLVGLKQAAESIDRMERQIDENTRPGGRIDAQREKIAKELKDLLREAKRDLSDLIKQVEGAGDSQREKLVFAFVKEREKTILAALRLQKEFFRDARIYGFEMQGAFLSVPREFDRVFDRVPRELLPELYGIVSLIPWSGAKDRILHMEGMQLTFKTDGRHEVKFVTRGAPNLSLRIGNKNLRPFLPTETNAKYELPAADLKDLFFDLEEQHVPVQLVEAGKAQKIRYVGVLRLEPLFPVKYGLREWGATGPMQYRTVEKGLALQDILQNATDLLKEQKAQPVTIAARHGRIYQLARDRLPYGESKVTLSPGNDNNWELDVRVDGQPRTLTPGSPTFQGVTVQWSQVPNPDGAGKVTQLIIKVRRPRSP